MSNQQSACSAVSPSSSSIATPTLTAMPRVLHDQQKQQQHQPQYQQQQQQQLLIHQSIDYTTSGSRCGDDKLLISGYEELLSGTSSSNIKASSGNSNKISRDHDQRVVGNSTGESLAYNEHHKSFPALVGSAPLRQQKSVSQEELNLTMYQQAYQQKPALHPLIVPPTGIWRCGSTPFEQDYLSGKTVMMETAILDNDSPMSELASPMSPLTPTTVNNEPTYVNIPTARVPKEQVSVATDMSIHQQLNMAAQTETPVTGVTSKIPSLNPQTLAEKISSSTCDHSTKFEVCYLIYFNLIEFNL